VEKFITQNSTTIFIEKINHTTFVVLPPVKKGAPYYAPSPPEPPSNYF